jgi:hypothetical protein
LDSSEKDFNGPSTGAVLFKQAILDAVCVSEKNVGTTDLHHFLNIPTLLFSSETIGTRTVYTQRMKERFVYMSSKKSSLGFCELGLTSGRVSFSKVVVNPVLLQTFMNMLEGIVPLVENNLDDVSAMSKFYSIRSIGIRWISMEPAPLTDLSADSMPSESSLSDSDGQSALASQPDADSGDTFYTEVEGRRIPESRRPSRQKNTKIPPEPPGVPAALLPFVHNDPESFTYRCLSGEKIPRLDHGISKSVISDLYRYMNVAVDNDLIGEALYIQEIIDGLRADKIFLKMNVDQSIVDLDRRIQEATVVFNTRMTQFVFSGIISNPRFF